MSFEFTLYSPWMFLNNANWACSRCHPFGFWKILQAIRLASHLWKILARSMTVNGFPSVCSSHDSRFGTPWFPSSFARSTRAPSSALKANFNWVTAPSVPGPARLTLSVALTRPFRSWVTWWDNRLAEHGNGFCLGLSVSVLIGRDRKYRIDYLWAVKRLMSQNITTYLIAVKQRKVFQETEVENNGF